MACAGPGISHWEPTQADAALSKPHILLVASRSIAATKFAHLCRSFFGWSEVRAVATKASFHFIDIASLSRDIILYIDEDERSRWNTTGDSLLPIELRVFQKKLSFSYVSVYTWDFSKPLFVAPAMNTLMWNNSFTQQHIRTIKDELRISLILHLTINGAMTETDEIYGAVQCRLQSQSPRGHDASI
ncbi:PREDICTED: phosphopantothenoylcysteine [Prunus dulcis]|uniref:PREDICTED: phosphopantothenoylcysteine n=1 Tax=Prunus dulcis TaxID=3755 RepID=A0A5E4G6X7_PRUDU|nr:PREDICTED: phosphopantothenoylcysteine [Prunus dulcis]